MQNRHVREGRGAVTGQGQLGDFAVVKINNLASILNNGRNVGSGEVFVISHAQDQRAALAGGDQAVGVFAVDHQQTEGAFQAADGVAHGLQGAVFKLMGDQVDDDLGVGLALELHALVDQIFAQNGVILDDAVVDHREAAVAAQVGVRVADRRLAMGGPAGVGHADGGPFGFLDIGIELGHPPHVFMNDEVSVLEHGEAGRVIAAVFEVFEPFDQ